MTTVSDDELPLEPPEDPGAPTAKGLTIGAVCKGLSQEFPDISISKIRDLEDQKLLNPRRTRGGYRLYTPSDVARLRTILRLQRDEFLPLRVIRQELASGRSDGPGAPPDDGGGGGGGRDGTAARVPRGRRPPFSVRDRGALYAADDLLEETGAPASLLRELEDFGIIGGELREGRRLYDETDREIVRAAAELARYGVGGRHLRVFRSSADREAALLTQILAPGLRSRNPERRKEAVQALEDLATVASHLAHLLLVRDLRRVAG